MVIIISKTIKVACLHAHHSNISYIEDAFSKTNIIFLHVVNPILLHELNASLNVELIKAKLSKQIDDMLLLHVNAIIITCTTYSGLYNTQADIPILKIDSAFLSFLTKQKKHIHVLFTNPTTVQTLQIVYLQFKKTIKVML